MPATSFCEPNDSRAEGERATWHWFALNGDEPRPLFAFAGLWRRHKGPVKKAGPPVDLDVYAFLTTTPNPLVATINHERMPVLLISEVREGGLAQVIAPARRRATLFRAVATRWRPGAYIGRERYC